MMTELGYRETALDFALLSSRSYWSRPFLRLPEWIEVTSAALRAPATFVGSGLKVAHAKKLWKSSFIDGNCIIST
jgi:hypothetical protein